MTQTVRKTRVADLMEIIEEFVVIDGYYTRRDELHVRGTAISPNEDWPEELKKAVEPTGNALRIDRSGSNTYVTVYPDKKGLPWLNLMLFGLTLITVAFSYTFVEMVGGGFGAAIQAATDIDRFWSWQPFTASLLLILLFHEFGHYFAAKRREIRVSLPYFIPAPTFIGTFGAFIKSKSPFTSRRDLLEVGAWGPVAGFVVATVILAISMTNVTTVPAPESISENAFVVEPLIMRILEPFFLTQDIPDGHLISLPGNPMLFAAWVGLLVTALNLLPVGQLDGGHIIYALFPRLHGFVSRAVFIALIGFGFMWPGWWLWAALIFFLIRFKHPPTLDDYVPLRRGSKWLGWTAIVIFVLTFSPAPI